MLLPLDTKDDLARWYSECEVVEKSLETKYPDYEFEHEAWHFFNDADIRFRDMGYRDYQHRLMSDYVARLRNEIKKT